jgi:hypothetical protein
MNASPNDQNVPVPPLPDVDQVAAKILRMQQQHQQAAQAAQQQQQGGQQQHQQQQIANSKISMLAPLSSPLSLLVFLNPRGYSSF